MRETLADRMSSQLRQQILSGRLAPGQAMPTERELGDAFGVGRTTVREALRGLIHSGFLERRGHTLLVRDRNEIGADDVSLAEMAARISVEDLYDTRKALEAHAVALAARNWADGDIDALREALEQMKGKLGADYHAADVAFHMLIARIGKNAVMQQVYEMATNLFFKLPSFWRVFSPQQGPAKPITGYDGHRSVVDAIEARDADLAVRLSDELLDRVKHTLIERMNRDGSASADAVAETVDTPTETPTMKRGNA
ncbi:MAG TPA: FCD domain-containing protein [Ilumatobacteraceae bacterium]|nr:FCD domain-containing protein [Ilumatobacteraceae bacterium]